MRRVLIVAVGAIAVSGLGWVARAQGGQAAPAAPLAPTNKAAYIDSKEVHGIWIDEEARKVSNKRVLEGGSHSINIRIVLPNSAPLVHALSGDTWVVMEGTATAITGGELLDIKRNPTSDDTSGSAIKGGIEQALKPGDILFVPPGVPHGFKDMKGFRAYLIRYPTK